MHDDSRHMPYSLRHDDRPMQWELWWAYTLFYDATGVKMRPVIILESCADMIPVIELTSHAPRDWLVWQYPLIDWARAGLRQPSTAVLSAVSTVPKEALVRRIGRLAYSDIMNIECMMEMQRTPYNAPMRDIAPNGRIVQGAEKKRPHRAPERKLGRRH